MRQQCTAQCATPPAAVPASRVEKGSQTFAVKVPARQLADLPRNVQLLQIEADRHKLLAPMKRGVVRVLHVEMVSDLKAHLQLPLLFTK